ncbi:MAG: sigma-70 family RNA polymerase sigma factor, partial [Actinophytocola sp.]|nr:sigma-70 family RNA polymerase sigma factor [Actinophytocola sp.]
MARDAGDHPMEKPNAGHVDLNRRYGDYQRRVFRYVRKHHPDVSAEDVAQETVERVLRRRYDNPGDALLFKIATNIVHDLRRRRQVASHLSLDLCIPSPAISPEEQTIDKLDGHLARRALAELGPSDRKLIESVHIDDVDRRDLSQREHITYAALRKRLSRARRRLCAHFARLSRVMIPAWVGFDLLRSLRRNLQTVMLAGASGVAVVAAVGFGPGLGGPYVGPDADGDIQAPPTSVITADAWSSSSGSASVDVPESDRFATPRSATSEVASVGGQSAAVAEPVLPVRSSLEVSPGTGAGRKQTNLIVVDTPLGPVATGGHSDATGPALGSG